METMKKFNAWLNRIMPIKKLVKNIEKTFLMQKPIGEQGCLVGIDVNEANITPPGISKSDWTDFLQLMTNEIHRAVEMKVYCGLLLNGPKVFIPTKEQFISLAITSPSVPCELYKQPFDTLCVIVPEGIFVRRSGKPVAVVGRYYQFEGVFTLSIVCPQDDLANLTHYDSHYYDGRNLDIRHGKLNFEYDHSAVHQYDDKIIEEDDDKEILEKLKNVFINVNLLLTQYGTKRIGSSNPEHEAKLENDLKKKLPESVRRAKEEALKILPVIYGFEQSVKIYETEDDGPHLATGTGQPVKPHWRRGHWRHQPYGKEMGLRKLIFINAVLVNSFRFGGELSNTRVSLHT